MSSLFFQPKPANAYNNLLMDFLNVVRDILVLINNCYHSAFLDLLINLFPEQRNNPSPAV